MEDLTVINFFAGPGAGKSTTAAGVFTLLKLHNVESELVPEFAKDLVWEERMRTFQDQTYIFAKQAHRIWRVSGKVKVAVTDSPFLLSNIYRRDMTSNTFKTSVLEEFNKYNNLNFFIERSKPYLAYGRNESESEAGKIDVLIKNYLSAHGLDYISIPGNTEGINRVISLVFNALELGDIKHKIE